MSSNVTRVRKMQHELDDAEERAGMAETTVSKLLVRTRQQTTKVAMVSLCVWVYRNYFFKQSYEAFVICDIAMETETLYIN